MCVFTDAEIDCVGSKLLATHLPIKDFDSNVTADRRDYMKQFWKLNSILTLKCYKKKTTTVHNLLSVLTSPLLSIIYCS